MPTSSASSRRTGRPTCCSSTPSSAEARGLQVLIAGAGGRGAPARDGGGEDGAAGARRAGRVEDAEGDGLAALDRADAGGHPGRDARDRPAGRGQCGAARGGDPRARATGASASGSRRYRASRRRSVLDAARSGSVSVATADDARRVHRRRAARAHARRSPGMPLGLALPVPRPVARPRRRPTVGRARRRRLRRPGRARPLGAGADVVTYEFENVPVAAPLRALAAAAAAARALELGQDRLVEKELFRRLGIPTPGSASLEPTTGAAGARQDAALGYDGKGQRPASAPSEPSSASDELAEELVAFDRELSIVAVRGRDGETASGRSPRTCTATASSASHASPRRRRAAGEAEALARRAARRARLRRRARARAVRGRRHAARERVRSARPQHGPLDDRRRRHEPVREPPAGDPRPPARIDRARRTGGDDQPDRRCRARALLGCRRARPPYGKEPRPGGRSGT